MMIIVNLNGEDRNKTKAKLVKSEGLVLVREFTVAVWAFKWSERPLQCTNVVMYGPGYQDTFQVHVITLYGLLLTINVLLYLPGGSMNGWF